MTGRGALVTGASGFIGGHLVERLLEAGRPVIALARPGSTLSRRWGSRLTVVECSELNEAELRKAFGSYDFDVIFHLAASGTRYYDRDIDQILRVNVEMPAALVRLGKARGAGLLMAGTFSEYRRPAAATPITEDAPLETGKIYGASKAAGGLVACALATQLRASLRILRLFHVYGPGEAEHRLLPSLIAGLRQGRHVSLSPGTQVRDFVYVDDVVECLIRAEVEMKSSSEPSTAVWNVCTGVGHSVRNFATTVAAAMGVKAELLGFGDLPMRRDDEPWLVGSAERLKRSLGWQPHHDIESGVRAAVARLMAIEWATS